ncbi:peptidylprolyl isomerase [Desulforhopalus vacuolatus]|nr:peptidylprolyl isomerase [Desulforhopalus vacuolatus]
MMAVKNGDGVEIHYTGRLADGMVFDTSRCRDPLQFRVGTKQVIPGIDGAVIGMEIGEKKSVHIPTAEAYGLHRPERIFRLPREKIPEGLDPEPGEQLEMPGPHGGAVLVTVMALEAEEIVLDPNPPLAGQDLYFDIELVDVEEPE